MLFQVAGYVGGLYVARTYVRDRMEELKEKLEIERTARDNLQRRFHQTQEDISYTVQALLPTLSEQILQTMDLELLTNELQARSKSRPKPSTLSTEGAGYPSANEGIVDSTSLPPRIVSDLSAPVDTSGGGGPESSESLISAGSVSQSWVLATGSQQPQSRSPTPSTSATTSSFAESSEESDDKDGRPQAVVRAANGPLTTSTLSITSTVTMSPATPGSSGTRSKTELWNEVKMLTFTRTLTTLYSITLLCLFTNLQLTVLARSKYITSVLEHERDECVRELEAGLTTSNLIFGSLGLGPAVGSRLESLLSGGSADDDELSGERVFQGDRWRSVDIGEDAESKYLTLSWWLLHVGWKDVSERVRRAVEETFVGVSLKTKIAIMDLHQLINDVRRRVEHEITFEGTEKRTDFLSSLLPPTPETICHVLTQGGYTPAPYPHRSIYTGMTESSLTSSQLSHDFANPPMPIYYANPRSQGEFMSATPPPHVRLLEEPFATLLSETRSALSSPDFAQVFEVCLDHATDILFDSLEKNIFRPGSGHEGDEGVEEVRIRLAALLPGLAKWSQLALNGFPNELIDKTLSLREVSCFSAISFSRFEEQVM